MLVANALNVNCIWILLVASPTTLPYPSHGIVDLSHVFVFPDHGIVYLNHVLGILVKGGCPYLTFHPP